ncbi:MAG: hypothetical protein QM762_12715 [Chryseolinea sp.]
MGKAFFLTGAIAPLGSAGSFSTTTSYTVTHNTNPRNPGNLLIVSFYSGGNNVTITAPDASWTRIAGGYGVNGTMWTFYKTIQVGEASSYIFTGSSNATGAWCLNEFTGIDTDIPPVVVQSTTTGSINELTMNPLVIEKPSFIYTLAGNLGTTDWNVSSPGTYNTGTVEQTRVRCNYRYALSGGGSETIVMRPANYPTNGNTVRGEAYMFTLKVTK